MITIHFPTGRAITYATANDYKRVTSASGIPAFEILRKDRKETLLVALVQARDIVLTFGSEGWHTT